MTKTSISKSALQPEPAARGPSTAAARQFRTGWHQSPRMAAQRRQIEAAFGAAASPQQGTGAASAVRQMKMGFEFQVLNQEFFDKLRDTFPTDKQSFTAKLGSVSIERDGRNPEFVTAAYDEETTEPEVVEKELSVIPENFPDAVELIANHSKPPLIPVDGIQNSPTADVQATGGFNLSQVVGWYQALAAQKPKSDDPFKPKTGKREGRNVDRHKSVAKGSSQLKWQATLPPELAKQAPAAVKGLMLLAQANVEAMAATQLKSEINAPGVKTLTAVLPKSNLSTLYLGMSKEEQLSVGKISEAIKGSGGHPWQTPIKMEEPENGQLKWEPVKRWSFLPALYVDDIIHGFEPMWLFEGFSEIDVQPNMRQGMYEEFEDTHGNVGELQRDREAARSKWETRVDKPTKEAILEMRDFGSNAMPLSQVSSWARHAFALYRKFRSYV